MVIPLLANDDLTPMLGYHRWKGHIDEGFHLRNGSSTKIATATAQLVFENLFVFLIKEIVT